jgi:hypothetical protein
MVSDSADELANKLRQFRKTLSVVDTNGRDMVVDWPDPAALIY